MTTKPAPDWPAIAARWRAITDRANRQTLAYVLAYARQAREAGQHETAAEYDRMADHLRRKIDTA